MSDVRDTLLRYYGIWRSGNAHELAAFLSSDYVDHNPLPGYGCDRDAAVTMAAGFGAAMSVVALDVGHVIVDPPYAAAHWTMRCVPTEAARSDTSPVHLRGHDFFRVRHGLICEIWHCESRVP